MPDTPTSWKTIRDQRTKEGFTGRAAELQVFSTNLTGPEPQYMLLAVLGEGGIGKTTLLNRFAFLATSAPFSALPLLCNEGQTAPLEVMISIAERLSQLGTASPAFDLARQDLPNAPVPPPGPRLGEGLSPLAPASHQTDRSGDAETKTIAQLSPLFLSLLVNACRQRPLVLLFDSFERTRLSPWLHALCNFEYGEFDTRLTFVLASRQPLDPLWDDLAGLTCRLPLAPFTFPETRQYLASQHISDPQLVTQIYLDTGGLPVLVEWLAAARPQPSSAMPDAAKDPVARFLAWTPQEERRQAALLAAVPRHLETSLFQAALASCEAAATGGQYTWLVAQPYLRPASAGGYTYPQEVRALLLEHLQETAPQALTAAHASLVEHYAAQQARLGLSGREAFFDERWQTLECERVYHLASRQPAQDLPAAVSACLHALRRRSALASRLVPVLQQAGVETCFPDLQDWASHLAALLHALTPLDPAAILAALHPAHDLADLDPLARAEIHALRGAAYRLVAQPERALLELNQSLKIDPDDLFALLNRASSYLALGQPQPALADFDAAIEQAPHESELFAQRAAAYRQLGRFEQARVDLDHLIELKPPSSATLQARADTNRQLGRLSEALPDYNRAIDLDPHSWQAFAGRAALQRSLGLLPAALEDYNSALELAPNDAPTLAGRAALQVELGNYESALADYNHAIELAPRDARLHAGRAETYRRLGRYERALADLNHAVELDPQYTWAIATRGQTYQLIGQLERALADLNRALQLAPDDAWSLAARAETHRLLGQFKPALADFDRAVELNPGSAWALAHRGETYRLLGRYEQALADFNRAAQLDEKYSWAVAHRGATYRQLGHLDRALADLNIAIEDSQPRQTEELWYP